MEAIQAGYEYMKEQLGDRVGTLGIRTSRWQNVVCS